jgi:hypothetical protein
VIDTNGNGRLDAYAQPNQPVDPAKDKRLNAALFGVGVNPVDGTVWGSVLGYPGLVLRFDPRTKLSEIYEPPFPGFGPRGFDIDRNGVAYVPLSSGHLAAFDRRKCRGPLNGPQAAQGRLCPEGWTLTPFPGPQFRGVAESGSAEASYYTWVDQFNASGLGANVPMATGNANESLMALVDGKWVNMRVPYPLGFYAKGMDGRIDDPNAGWKGRGVWTTYATRTPFHMETGKGTRPKLVKFQIRPNIRNIRLTERNDRGDRPHRGANTRLPTSFAELAGRPRGLDRSRHQRDLHRQGFATTETLDQRNNRRRART